MPRTSRFDMALRWMTPKVADLFHAEIQNEVDGGVAPATLDSTIDSVSQAPEIMCEGWEQNDWTALLMIVSNVGLDAQVEPLFRAYCRKHPSYGLDPR